MTRRPWKQLRLSFQLELFDERAERSEHSERSERSPSRGEQDHAARPQEPPQSPDGARAGVEGGASGPALSAPLSKACARPLPPGVIRRPSRGASR